MRKRINELKGLIHQKYASEAELSRKLQWNRQRLNKITNGDKEPDLEEVYVLASALGTTLDEMVDIFLTNKSPNGQQERAS